MEAGLSLPAQAQKGFQSSDSDAGSRQHPVEPSGHRGSPGGREEMEEQAQRPQRQQQP